MSRDRDKIVEDALKHELRRTTSAQGNACLDAEMLAAWEDGGLDATTMAAMETHVSGCSRCQAMVAISARGPAGQRASGPAVSTAPDSFASWKWLVPIAAGAAAVTLWMVMPGQRQVAVAPPQPPAAPAATLADSKAKAAPQASNRFEARGDTVKSESADRSSAGASPATNEKPALPAQNAEAAEPNPAAQAQTLRAPARRAVDIEAPIEPRNQITYAPLEVVSPLPAQRWRVTEKGIERSRDLGGTWALVRESAGETIAAGVSPAPDVCWLIGNNGVALITTNGSVFTRIDIPDAGNLRTISATDARSATVVNAAGRSFRTDDGGRTWR